MPVASHAFLEHVNALTFLESAIASTSSGSCPTEQNLSSPAIWRASLEASKDAVERGKEVHSIALPWMSPYPPYDSTPNQLIIVTATATLFLYLFKTHPLNSKE